MISHRRRSILFSAIIFSALALLCVAPFAAHAQSDGSSINNQVTAPNIWTTPPGFWGPIISCSGEYQSLGSMKPCTSLTDLTQTFVNAIYFAMSLALFVIVPILFIVGGLMMMFAGANPEMVTRGRQTLTATVIGLVIVLAAYLIVSTVINVLHITGVAGFGS